MGTLSGVIWSKQQIPFGDDQKKARTKEMDAPVAVELSLLLNSVAVEHLCANKRMAMHPDWPRVAE
jgi:hypothetical protein